MSQNSRSSVVDSGCQQAAGSTTVSQEDNKMTKKRNNADKKRSRKKSAKRQRNADEWLRNKSKVQRNLGEKYISVHSKKEVRAREMGPPCQCRLGCGDKISFQDRFQIFTDFWNLADWDMKRFFISTLMKDIVPRQRSQKEGSNRDYSKAYYLKVDRNEIRVCATFFKSTLDISNKIIQTVKEKITPIGTLKPDMRGKHKKRSKVSEDIQGDICEVIISTPDLDIDSDYQQAQCNDDTSLES